MASCHFELGHGETALHTARKALDVFETAHDHHRETFALLELGKAQVLLNRFEEGLATFEMVLQTATDEDPRDFELIVDVETRMATVMRSLGRIDAADEIMRRLASISEILDEQEEGA
jgi:predicted negative regulator of RcsB-dependent stress response